MKTPIIVLPLLFLAIFIHSADERANMLKIFEADPIPDEMMAKIHALSNGSELSPEMVAHLKACEATAHTQIIQTINAVLRGEGFYRNQDFLSKSAMRYPAGRCIMNRLLKLARHRPML